MSIIWISIAGVVSAATPLMLGELGYDLSFLGNLVSGDSSWLFGGAAAIALLALGLGNLGRRSHTRLIGKGTGSRA